MRIHLNGLDYELKPNTGVQRQPIQEFPDSTRSQGQQDRSDRALMSTWEFNDFTWGSGIERMDIDQERDKASYWKSTLDTRWRGRVVLPPLVIDTVMAQGGQYGTLFPLPMLIDDDFNALLLASCNPTDNVPGYVFTDLAPTAGAYVWEYNGHVFEVGSNYGVINIKAVAYEYEEDKDYFYVSKTLMAGIMTKSRGGVATLMYQTRGTCYDPSKYSCSQFYRHMGTMHIGAYDHSLDKAYIHPILSGTLEENSTNFQHEPFHAPFLASTPDGLFAGSTRGVSQLNLEQKTYTEKLDLSQYASFYNGVGMTSWGNEYLIVPYRDPNGVGGLIAYNTVDQVSLKIGMDLDDGVPSGWSSEVIAMKTTPDFLFAVNARPISSYSPTGWNWYREGGMNLMAYDGYGWHYMGMVGTESQSEITSIVMSRCGDGIPKLIVVPTGAGTQDNYHTPKFIKYPLSNPLSQIGYEFATQGALTYPIFNAGMPEFETGFYSFIVEADSLGSGRTVEVLYGLNGAEPTQSLGFATQSGTRILKFNGGLGVEGYSIQMQVILTRGTDKYRTPVLVTHHSPVLQYMKFPEKREMYQFTISTKELARADAQRPARAQVGSLLAIKSLRTLVPFWYSSVGTKNVKMLSVSTLEVSDKDREFTADADVELEIVLAELI